MSLPAPRTAQLQILASGLISRQRESFELLMQKHFSVTECAASLGVHRSTFRKWLHSGIVAFSRSGPRGRIRVAESELQRLLKGQGA